MIENPIVDLEDNSTTAPTTLAELVTATANESRMRRDELAWTIANSRSSEREFNDVRQFLFLSLFF